MTTLQQDIERARKALRDFFSLAREDLRSDWRDLRCRFGWHLPDAPIYDALGRDAVGCHNCGKVTR